MKKIFMLVSLLASCVALYGQEPANDEIIDTLDTDDRYVKVILKSDFTWEYLEKERPQIDTADMDEDNWDNSVIHAYKNIKLDELPEETELCLTDSINGWCCPKIGPVNSQFKFRRYREHRGTDIGLNVGDTVRAAFDGKVRVVMVTGKTGGYGNLVVIRHPNGLETYYGHLSQHDVKENDLVKAGDIIGLGGSTGRSTGPHLHFETRYQGHPFDPERVFDFTTGKLRDSIFVLKKHYFSIYSHYGQTDKESKSQSGHVVHKVRNGDTLGAIARKYHTSVAKICRLNHMSPNKTLRIGQRLIVR